jgi:flagellar hook-basal body protein
MVRGNSHGPPQKTRTEAQPGSGAAKQQRGGKWRPMDNSFMVGLSAQQVLRQRMDTTANNLANMTTAGFKVEHIVSRELSEKPATAADTATDIAFTDAWMLQRDFSTGPLEQTGNPLDFAIEGDGFFVVQTAAGEAFTRDGRFNLDDQGQIITRTGELVMGDGGPITVDPEGCPSHGRDPSTRMELSWARCASRCSRRRAASNGLGRTCGAQPTRLRNRRRRPAFAAASSRDRTSMRCSS